MKSIKLLCAATIAGLLSTPCYSAANDSSGVYAIWANERNYDLDFVKGGQVVVHWKTLQTGPNAFDFTVLDDKLKSMKDHGVKTTIQIMGNNKPDFLFNKVPYYPDALSHQVKDAKGTLMYWHPYHLDQFKKLLQATADHVANSKFKSIITGIRMNYNRVGTEHGLNTTEAPALNKWIVPNGVSFVPTMTSTEYKTYKSQVEKVYFEEFAPLMTVLVREHKKYSSRVVNGLQAGKAGIYQTGSEMEPRFKADEESRYGPFLKYCRTGIAKYCYSEPWAASDGSRGGGVDQRWSTYAQHNYWRALIDLHTGVSAVAMYGEDLDRHGKTEYMKTFNFVNKYAGFHNLPKRSPGAWIAFREGEFLQGDYTFLMSRSSGDANFVGLDLRDDGKWALGDQNSRYAAWARKLSAGSTATVAADQEFVTSMSGQTKKVSVTYLDRGNGKMTVTAFGKSFTQNVGNSSDWKTATFTVTGGNNSNSVSVKAVDSDLTLHMVEINRQGGATATETELAPPSPPAAIQVDAS